MNRRAVAALQVLGVAAIVLGSLWLHAHRVAPVPYALRGSFQLTWAVVLVGLLAASGYALGLPDLAARRSDVVACSVAAFAASALGVSVSQLALGDQLLPRFVLAFTALVVPLWALLVWNLSGDVRSRERSRDRVLVVADQRDEVAALCGDLAGSPERAAVVVAHLAPEAAAGDLRAAPLLDAARRLAPTVVVLDSLAQRDPRVVDQVAELHRAGVRFRTMSLFYEHWVGKIPVGELQRVALLSDIGELHRTRYTRVKRVVDVAFALVGLVVLVPVAAVIAAVNPWANPGPLLFRQDRVGKDGRTFEILKFRSMRPAAADGAHPWTARDDDRVGRVGRLLRRSHLDELPQVLNILRGDLSLVGPRPEQVRYVEELRAKLPFYDSRHLVRPGLTGWAQVKFGYAASEGDALEKLQYDLYYLRRQGIALDLRIVVRTLRAVGRGFGR